MRTKWTRLNFLGKLLVVLLSLAALSLLVSLLYFVILWVGWPSLRMGPNGTPVYLLSLLFFLLWLVTLLMEWGKPVRFSLRFLSKPGMVSLVLLLLSLVSCLLAAILADESALHLWEKALLASAILILVICALIRANDALAVYWKVSERLLLAQAVVFLLTLGGVIWYAQEAHMTREETTRIADATIDQAKQLGRARAAPWITDPILTAREARENGELTEESPIPDNRLLVEVTNRGTMSAVGVTVAAGWLRDPTNEVGSKATMRSSIAELDGRSHYLWEIVALSPGHSAWLCFSAPPQYPGLPQSAQTPVRLAIVWWDPSYVRWDLMVPIERGNDGKWHPLPYHAKPLQDRPLGSWPSLQ